MGYICSEIVNQLFGLVNKELGTVHILSQVRKFNMGKKPGTNTGDKGGIFQEIGPDGVAKPNFATVPDNKPLPPTTESGNTWKPIKVTPDSKRGK